VTADSSGAIHDTPVQGTTAVVVQLSPGQHGADMVESRGTRQFCIPYGDFSSATPYIHLDTDKYFDVPQPYREVQASIVRFFDEGFQGKVPSVVVPKPPVRDLDADGYTDDVDAAPCDPHVH
jgi:hypothetical protein